MFYNDSMPAELLFAAGGFPPVCAGSNVHPAGWQNAAPVNVHYRSYCVTITLNVVPLGRVCVIGTPISVTLELTRRMVTLPADDT